VFLFFILSGYVMSYVYPSPVCWRDFFTARLARLLPVYEVTLLAVLPVLLWSQHEGRTSVYHPPITAGNVAANIFMIQQWLPMKGWYSINHPAWSLSVEAFLYVVMFPVLILSRRFVGRRGLYMALVAWGVGGGTLLYSGHFYLLDHCWYLPLLVGLAGFGTGFGLENLSGRPLQYPRFVAGLALALIGGSLLYRVVVPDGTRLFLVMGLVLLVVASAERGWAYRLLARPALLYLGDISYSLYLSHVPIELFFAALRERAEGLVHARWGRMGLHFVELGLILGCSFAVATLSYRYLEVPFRRLIRDRFVRPEPGAQARGFA